MSAERQAPKTWARRSLLRSEARPGANAGAFAAGVAVWCIRHCNVFRAPRFCAGSRKAFPDAHSLARLISTGLMYEKRSRACAWYAAFSGEFRAHCNMRKFCGSATVGYALVDTKSPVDSGPIIKTGAAYARLVQGVDKARTANTRRRIRRLAGGCVGLHGLCACALTMFTRTFLPETRGKESQACD
jgi:hypothetical protein